MNGETESEREKWALYVSACAEGVWSPSAAEQEGSCVITHSTALTSSINSGQILMTCFQDVALPL